MNIFNEKPKYEKVEESPMGLYSSIEELKAARKAETEKKKAENALRLLEKKEEEQKRIILTNMANREKFLKNKEEKEHYLDDEENFQRVYTKANRLIGPTEIDEEIFKKRCITDADLFELKDDIIEEKKLEEKFNKKAKENKDDEKIKQRATILEGIISIGITHGDWFGSNIKIHPATKFDDFKNHIDGILEIDDKENPSNYVALGVDASSRAINTNEDENESENGKFFDKKINDILDYIDQGMLLEVRYFADLNEEPHEKFFVPKVVLSSGNKILNELALLFDKRDEGENNEKLKKHYFSSMIFEQILGQCYIFADYAKNEGMIHISDAYEKVINHIVNLAEKDEKIKKLYGEYNDKKLNTNDGIVVSRIKFLAQKRLKINTKESGLSFNDAA